MYLNVVFLKAFGLQGLLMVIAYFILLVKGLNTKKMLLRCSTKSASKCELCSNSKQT